MMMMIIWGDDDSDYDRAEKDEVGDEDDEDDNDQDDS